MSRVPALRPKLSWSDLAGARVGVWGLGREGHANLRKLLALGVEPVLVDDHPPAAPVLPPGGRPVLATGDGGLAALEGCDVVVKTPGLSRYRPDVARLAGLGIPVVGGLGLWLAEADLRRVLCVTGTKGKSTTSSVTGHLLTQLGYRCMVGGNIGASPYDPAEPGDADFWVIEVSSYQATDLPCSPPVVAVTSLHPDHLDWHGGVEQYYRDKLSACSQPGAELTVANGDSDLLKERTALLGPRVEWVSEHDDPGADWMEPLGLLGRHNRRNALIARRCLVALGVLGAGDEGRLRAAAAGYRHLPSRLAPIGTVGPRHRLRPAGRRRPGPPGAHLRPDPPRQRPPHPRRHRGGPDRGGAAGGRLRRRDRLPRHGRRRGRGIPLGAAGRGGTAVPGRAKLRAVPGLPRPRRGLRPRHVRAFVTM